MTLVKTYAKWRKFAQSLRFFKGSQMLPYFIKKSVLCIYFFCINLEDWTCLSIKLKNNDLVSIIQPQMDDFELWTNP